MNATFYKIMAIGTLALCYNNVEVFRGVVKMRRGKISSDLNMYIFHHNLRHEVFGSPIMASSEYEEV